MIQKLRSQVLSIAHHNLVLTYLSNLIFFVIQPKINCTKIISLQICMRCNSPFSSPLHVLFSLSGGLFSLPPLSGELLFLHEGLVRCHLLEKSFPDFHSKAGKSHLSLLWWFVHMSIVKYSYCIVIIYIHVWLTTILEGRDHGLLKGVFPTWVYG